MSTFIQKSFYCNPKYEVIKEELLKLNWIQYDSNLHRYPDLIWDNLKEIVDKDGTSECSKLLLANSNLDSPLKQWINHYENSNLFSNKANFAKLLEEAKNFKFSEEFSFQLQPPTWSSKVHDWYDLIALLLSVSIIFEPHLLKLHKDIFQYLIDNNCNSLTSSNSTLTFSEFLNLSQEKFSNYLSDTWILKPEGGSCGDGIKISKGFKESLELIVNNYSYKCIVQKYVDKPLLLNHLDNKKRKFDIRQWIIVTSSSYFSSNNSEENILNNEELILIYGFSEFYIRLSTEEFSLDENNIKNSFIHLCNHAVQSKNEKDNTNNNNDENGDKCYSMMTHDEFIQELNKNFNEKFKKILNFDPFTSCILPQIKSLSRQAVHAVYPKLKPFGKSFELLGLDFIISENNILDSSNSTFSPYKVELLEVNTSPDISKSTLVTSRLLSLAIPSMFELLFNEKNELKIEDTKEKLINNPSWELWWKDSPILNTRRKIKKNYNVTSTSIPFNGYEEIKKIIDKHYNDKKNIVEDEEEEEEEDEI